MVAGLLLVLPLVITVWLVRVLFGIIHDNVTPWVMMVLRAIRLPDVDGSLARIVAPVVGLALTALSVYLFGVLAGNLLGRRIWSLVEAAILRIPLVKGIYGSSRQLLDAFGATSKGGFSKVVLVEYPRKGMWVVGFVTSDDDHRLEGDDGPSCVAVFLPTTPNPTSGWVVFVPRHDVLVLDVSIEEGMKLVVSGAIVMPGRLGPNVRRWVGAPERAPSA
jgi:uncharacterized membrane protein